MGHLSPILILYKIITLDLWPGLWQVSPMRNTNELALSAAKRWAAKIGRQKAISRLYARDLAFSTASKICGGIYESTPGVHTTNLLVEEMAQDGITIIDGEILIQE